MAVFNKTDINNVVYKSQDVNIFKIGSDEVWRRNFVLSFSKGEGISAFSQDQISVPYQSTITTNANTLTVTNHLGTVIATVKATASSGYKFSQWGSYSSPVKSAQTISAVGEKQKVYYTVNLSYTCGSLDLTSVSLSQGSTYSVNGNTIIFTDAETGVQTPATFTPWTTDTYYTYGTTASWSSTSGTITGNTTIYVTTPRTEKTYQLHLSWGQNCPRVPDGVAHGWDGDPSGNITITVLADHTYTIHREDSAGSAVVSYIALGNEKVATATFDIDHYYIGPYSFYFGDVVNDEAPSNPILVGYQTSTKTSLSMEWKPGDYIRDHGGNSIKLNIDNRQSGCWTTINSATGWKRYGSVSSGKTKEVSLSFSNVVAGNATSRPVIGYFGWYVGVTLSTWDWGNQATNSPYETYYNKKLETRITINNSTNGAIHLTVYNASRIAGSNYWGYRWIFQRNY